MSDNPLATIYGSLLVMRPPVPATINKAGANYKSEVAHQSYSPRRAFDEWTAIGQAIVRCGGDALFRFEESDEPYLDHKALHIDGDGDISPKGSGEVLGNIETVQTGRVFTANGPWVTVRGTEMQAIMQHMLPHRVQETSYYDQLLGSIAESSGYHLTVIDNPHRWEGMADVTAVGDKVILTYAVPGHYDEGTTPKSSRSTCEGVAYAADHAGVPEEARIYAELIYPHFHGDTVHYGARPTSGPPILVHYPGGLWGDGAERIAAALGEEAILLLSADDAVEQYAGNSRQVLDGVLIPESVSLDYEASLEKYGLTCHRVPLFELFGKAGGGPGCATLYLPSNLDLETDSPLRFSQRGEAVAERRERLPEELTVDPAFFEGRVRG